MTISATSTKGLRNIKLPWLATLILIGVTALSLPAQTVQTVTFSEAGTAPTYFANVSPGGPLGPKLTFTGLLLDGGVVLNDSNFAGGATTWPNIYVTSDSFPLQDGSLLPGSITGAFTSPQIFLRFDIANGGKSAANFTLTMFNGAHAVVATSSIQLAGYSLPGATGTLSAIGPDFESFSITSDQPKGSIDFAIDTLIFMSSSDPALASARILADSISNFSGTQGKNGWLYGYYANPPAGFTEMMTFNNTGSFAANGYVWYEEDGAYWTSLWSSGGHPESSNANSGRVPVNQSAVRRWTAGEAGTLMLIGDVAKTKTGGSGTTGRIRVDGTEIFSHILAGDDVTGVGYALTANVNSASNIDFTIEANQSDLYDWTTFVAIVLAPPGPPAALKVVSGDGQKVVAAMAAAAPLVVQVNDSAGHPVAGVQITFSGTNATVKAATATTDGNGQASTGFIAGSTIGPASVTASAPGLANVTFSLTVVAGGSTPYTCTNTLPVTITSIESASAYGGYSYFASGSWLEIKGSNLADPKDPRLNNASQSGQWSTADFNGTNAPTNLDGISVSMNSKPAYVWYLSPTQLNVQAPEDSATGPVAITVTNCNATSSPVMFARQAIAPGLLAPPNYAVNGTPYMVATFASDGAYVLNTSAGAAFGLNSRPAKPGDVILAYGVGFGDVTPAILPGTIVQQSNALVNSVTISFGSSNAALSYSGLAGSFVGLYEFYITVPAGLADGDYQINVTQNGINLPQTMYLTVHN